MSFPDMFRRRLFPQGLCAMCVTALALGGWSGVWAAARQPPPAAGATAEQASEAQYQIGLMYERSGRFEEAEAAFEKAIVDGSPQVRAVALEALNRVILGRERAERESLRTQDGLERCRRACVR
jgi:hypothetical protein